MLAAVALAAAACSWDSPGANSYQGTFAAAIDRYTDIPNIVRKQLKEKVDRHQYDDIATIGKHSIQGTDSYSDLYSMHFGNSGVCTSVSRGKWLSIHQEQGLVYCVEEHCIIIPSVCRNVSRINKLAKPNKLSFVQEYTDNISEAIVSPLDPVAFFVPEQSSFEQAGAGPTEQRRLSSRDYIPLFAPLWANVPSFVVIPKTSLVSPIPEPSTYLLMLLGLGAVATYTWWRKRK